MTDLTRAVRRYIVARETPGVSSERAYHEMRHALRRQENTGAADASRSVRTASRAESVSSVPGEPDSDASSTSGHFAASVAYSAQADALPSLGLARSEVSATDVPTDPACASRVGGGFSDRKGMA